MSRANFITTLTFNLHKWATFVSKLKLNMDLWERPARQVEIQAQNTLLWMNLIYFFEINSAQTLKLINESITAPRLLRTNIHNIGQYL